MVKYRPDIDGLRAVAIIGVLFYHSDLTLNSFKLFSGGFLGVDVFFVISGYLISSIIFKELDNEVFSIAGFYKKRVKQILPVYFFVTLVSLNIAYCLMSPDQIVDFGKQVVSSLFFVSNIFFSNESSYWIKNQGYRPFLHTWSLSIEEQFYVIIPFALYFFYKSKYFLITILFSIIISFMLAVINVDINEDKTFYLLQYRAWELLCGVFLAYLHVKGIVFNSKLINGISNLLGILLVFFSFVFFDSSIKHPYFYTLAPVFGAMMIIYSVDDKSISRAILSSKKMIFIGGLSYSLYLWHVPLFSFAKLVSLFEYTYVKILMIMFLFPLSYFSLKLIENPFRYIFKFKITLSYIFVSALFVFFWIEKSSVNGFAERLPHNIILSLENINSFQKVPAFEFSEDPKATKKKNIILIGDSHIGQFAPSLKEYNNYNIAVLNRAGCPFLLDLDMLDKNGNVFSKCSRRYQNKRMEFVEDNPNSIVIIGGRFPLYLNESRFDNQDGGVELGSINFDNKVNDDIKALDTIDKRNRAIKESLQKTVDRIILSGSDIILIYPIPEVGWDVPNRQINELLFNDLLHINGNKNITTRYQVFKDRYQISYNILDSIEGNNIRRVYPETIFCDSSHSGRCITSQNNMFLYKDNNHLSPYGNDLLAEYIVLDFLER